MNAGKFLSWDKTPAQDLIDMNEFEIYQLEKGRKANIERGVR